MREIIFRGKSKARLRWVYGSLYKEGSQVFILVCGRFYPEPSNGQSALGIMDWYEVFPDSIGQYTGLNPSLVKDEKLVFDGDIVKITDHTIEETFESCGALVTMLMTRTYEVFWNTTKWSIKLIEPMLGVDPPIFDLPTKNVTYEIIGNIHDQKEDV